MQEMKWISEKHRRRGLNRDGMVNQTGNSDRTTRK